VLIACIRSLSAEKHCLLGASDQNASGTTFTYSDYVERVLWLSQFHRALHNLKHRFEIEIEEAPERNFHGFKGSRLKQGQMALAV